MSVNAGIVRRLQEAFNRRDADGMIALAAPEFEAVTILGAMEGQVIRSHDQIRDWVRAVELDWEVFEVRAEEFYEVGVRVLALGTWRAKGRGSGVEVSSQPGAWLAHVRDGLVYRWRTYTDRAEALEALGVDQHELARYRVGSRNDETIP